MGAAFDQDQSAESQVAQACLPTSEAAASSSEAAAATALPGPAESDAQSANPVLASAGSPVASPPSLLGRIGDDLGIGAGVLVTEALRAVPSWNTPVLDGDGQPAASVPGADRIGDHDLVKRDEEVVGPAISGVADGMAPGAIHDLVAGFGAGATEAPGDSYRLEAGVSDFFSGK